jgi:hypothetical protein
MALSARLKSCPDTKLGWQAHWRVFLQSLETGAAWEFGGTWESGAAWEFGGTWESGASIFRLPMRIAR